MKDRSTIDHMPCWHCGKTGQLRLASRADEKDDNEDDEFGVEGATIYELLSCVACEGITVRSGHWHDGMEQEDFSSSVIFPKRSHFDAVRLWTQYEADRKFMRLAVDAAEKCISEEGRISPKVGAVLARGADLIQVAYRGEFKAGEHAEYTLLDQKCESLTLTRTTLYTTLEPCTERGIGKVSCARRIIQARIPRVVIGMLDPNDVIRGRGVFMLRDAGIQVDLFPRDMMNDLEGMNRAFIRDQLSRQATVPQAAVTSTAPPETAEALDARRNRGTEQ